MIRKVATKYTFSHSWKIVNRVYAHTIVICEVMQKRERTTKFVDENRASVISDARSSSSALYIAQRDASLRAVSIMFNNESRRPGQVIRTDEGWQAAFAARIIPERDPRPCAYTCRDHYLLWGARRKREAGSRLRNACVMRA